MRKKNGYVLIATAAGAIVLVGMLGMAIDLGRLYIARNEAQAFADAAALRAVMKLNGKSTGITNAQTAVSTSTNGWNMGTQSFASTDYTITFGQTATGTFVANPNPATNYGFVQIVATPSLPLTFIRMVGAPATQQVAARSVAGLVLATFPLGGYMPFTPFAHELNGNGVGQDSTGNFGLTPGQEYAMLWPGNLNNKSNACAGDTFAPDGSNNWPTYNVSDQVSGSTRGYFELQAASAISDAILGARQTMALSIGDVINLTNGQKQAEQNALTARAARDSDSANYSPSNSCLNSQVNCTVPAYAGNGQRLVIMPINNYNQATGVATVAGFGSFLIPMSWPNGGNKAWCAIYMGAAAVGATDVSPYTTGGAYVARLVQ